MIIMNMNDIADELGTLSALLDVARQEIKMAAEMINPEYSPTELKRGEALLKILDDRFFEVYRQAMDAVAAPEIKQGAAA